MLKNYTTPRIFIAATRQDDGKTTTSLGIVSALRKRFQRVGYIKPIGQRYVEIDGLKVDEDSVLINDTYNPGVPLDAMSPIAVDTHFTRNYLDAADPKKLASTIEHAFNRAAWEQDFVVIEGSGHAGVGSVFDMSNAQTARLLHSKAIIVSQGGVGRPIDEISLNLALFEKYKVEVVGVVLNKVISEKISELWPYAEKGLSRLGLPLLGIVPLNLELRKPTLNQIAEALNGEFVAGDRFKRRRVGGFSIATSSSRNAEVYFEPHTVLITAGDREDMILAILGGAGEGCEAKIAGVVLTQGYLPQPGLLKIMKTKQVPFISVKYDSFAVATKISHMSVKTEMGDSEKIGLIQNLIETNVDIDRIVASSAPIPFFN
ncbi:MAG: AAA family ATPase [Blastochloris sp.]|nr:AAA family ATPase [Blastochloris sp.]